MKKIPIYFLVLLALFTFPLLAFCQTDPIVSGNAIAITATESGNVKGYLSNGIYTFKGIPYAQSNRFTAPVKPTPWTGVRSSMTYGPVCPTDPTTAVNDVLEFAFNHNFGYSNEHCQSLNVWTQQLNDGKKRPAGHDLSLRYFRNYEAFDYCRNRYKYGALFAAPVYFFSRRSNTFKSRIFF
jgi:para-nitrobenzyl esterase